MEQEFTLAYKAIYDHQDREIELITTAEVVDKDKEVILVDGFDHDYLMNETAHKGLLQHKKHLNFGTIIRSSKEIYNGVSSVKQIILADDSKRGNATLEAVKSGLFPNISFGFIKSPNCKKIKNGITYYTKVLPFETSVMLEDTQSNPYGIVLKGLAEDIDLQDKIESLTNELELTITDKNNLATMLRQYESEIFVKNKAIVDLTLKNWVLEFTNKLIKERRN